MADYIKRHFIEPIALPIVIIGVLLAIIIVIGEAVLSLFTPGENVDRIGRPELWFAVGLSLVFLFGCAFLYTRPKGTLGPFDAEVAIGDRGIFEEPAPRIDPNVRQGPQGTVADIAEGYTLYAANGPLAEVQGLLPGTTDYGRKFKGLIYANGLSGASSELWIPTEAVMSVYPETKSALLAIKGDETEYFGWNLPPESMRRSPARKAEHL